jgi:trehalose-6-phosphatase
MAVEALPPVAWDKGRASHYILRHLFGVQWPVKVSVVYIGDDNTDETAMRALSGLATTFRVGDDQAVASAANHRLSDCDDVLTLLQHMLALLQISRRGVSS